MLQINGQSKTYQKDKSMSEQDKDENINSLNDDGQDPGTDPDTTDDNTVADTVEPSDNVDELKEKLQKQTEQNQRLFERAKKAEGFEKQPDGSWVKVQKKTTIIDPPPKSGDDLTSRDTIALIQAKVTEEADIAEVKDYAKLKGITVAEALKSKVVRAILDDREEERQTANATNTGRSRSGQYSPSGDALFNKAVKTGELPDKAEDLDKMLEARYTPKSKE